MEDTSTKHYRTSNHAPPELLKQLRNNRTEAELKWAFDVVKDRENWRNPINAQIPQDLKELVSAAIDYYTATEARFRLDSESGLLTVTANGYRAGPAGP